MTRPSLAVLLLIASCRSSCESHSGEPVLVRVSASTGLDAPELGSASGSAGYALDLVYDIAGELVLSSVRDGRRVVVELKEPRAAELAGAVQFRSLDRTEVLGPSRLAVNFADESSAAVYDSFDHAGVPIGPFALVEHDSDRWLLERRAAGPIDAIEIVHTTRQDEWRRLMARDIDVVPLAPAMYRAEFAGVDSIRVIDIPPKGDTALYLSVTTPELRDPAVRRALAAAIRRGPLARVACGEASCGRPDPPEPMVWPPLPESLSLTFLAGDDSFLAAAQVLAVQLRERGIELALEPLPLDAFTRRGLAYDYQLIMAPLGRDDWSYRRFLSPEHPDALSTTGYANPSYDAAIGDGDFARADQILAEDMPVTRLHELRRFAAVDGWLCGEVEPQSSSWRWIADLEPCGEP